MYRLMKTEKLPSGKFKQFVKTDRGDEEFVYLAIRSALIWPAANNPGYFLCAGEEVWDEELYSPASGRGVIRITLEYDHNDLNLDSFFAAVTDYMIAHLSQTCYADFRIEKDDFRMAFYNFLDRKGLRNISVEKAPYDDFVLRIGVVKSWDEAGDLSIDKDSPLYSELQSISRLDLVEPDVEQRFFRLNCLSYLLSGFQKYFPRRPLRFRKSFGGGDLGWMRA